MHFKNEKSTLGINWEKDKNRPKDLKASSQTEERNSKNENIKIRGKPWKYVFFFSFLKQVLWKQKQ